VESDAKLGLVAGLAGVVAVAVVYFQKPTEEGVAANGADTAVVNSPVPTPGPAVSTGRPQLVAKPTGYAKPAPGLDR
jgi:hypothetical protein